eukprot:3034195-Rhodomonas_salina.2
MGESAPPLKTAHEPLLSSRSCVTCWVTCWVSAASIRHGRERGQGHGTRPPSLPLQSSPQEEGPSNDM